MFYQSQPDASKEKYSLLLQSIGSLSELFSDNDIPYLYYRAAERIFCRSFSAEDLSREDSSFDAKYHNLGIGLKTFIFKNSGPLEKIAEFNSNSDTLRTLLSDKEELIRTVASLRNKRIQSTREIHGLDTSLYHCISRDKGRFLVYECPLDEINIEKLRIDKSSLDNNVLVFEDDSDEYRFNLSKSTLFKRFDVKSAVLEEIKIPIISDPFTLLESLLPNYFEDQKKAQLPSIILPLYSARSKRVEDKSGLNQWNAADRNPGSPRHPNELYIPIPSWINNQFTNFFPNPSQSFNLSLPNGTTLSAKRCQAGAKGLMSNPNKALGKWILRDILQIPEGVLCTKQMLDDVGIDSVLVEKIDEQNYNMSFLPSDSFENFQATYKV